MNLPLAFPSIICYNMLCTIVRGKEKNMKIKALYTQRYPCKVGFFIDDVCVDVMKFKDVQIAAEYLTKCGYYKWQNEIPTWVKDDNHEAFLIYTEIYEL